MQIVELINKTIESNPRVILHYRIGPDKTIALGSGLCGCNNNYSRERPIGLTWLDCANRLGNILHPKADQFIKTMHQ